MSGSIAESLFTQRVVVGVGDMAVSNSANVILSTYALGSCIGLICYDAPSRVCGLLHLMLPDSSIAPDKARNQPAMFADTGFALLQRSVAGLRGSLARSRAYVAGGAGVLSGSDAFRIGEKNIAAAQHWIQRLGIELVASDVGGLNNRTLHFNAASGELTMKSPVETRTISLRR